MEGDPASAEPLWLIAARLDTDLPGKITRGARILPRQAGSAPMRVHHDAQTFVQVSQFEKTDRGELTQSRGETQ